MKILTCVHQRSNFTTLSLSFFIWNNIALAVFCGIYVKLFKVAFIYTQDYKGAQRAGIRC